MGSRGQFLRVQDELLPALGIADPDECAQQPQRLEIQEACESEFDFVHRFLIRCRVDIRSRALRKGKPFEGGIGPSVFLLADVEIYGARVPSCR